MKNIVIIVLVILGVYWLMGHYDPVPLNHESLGLFNHGIHNIIGIVCLIGAGFLVWLWKIRKV